MTSDELAQLEAKFTAHQIQKEILSGRKPGDIVILMRSTTVSEYYLKELKKLGIACISDSSENFYDTREIQTIVNLLKIIDNPRQDIPLLGVLLSPIAGFTEEDLGILRMNNPEGDLYEAMLTYPEKGTNQLLIKKVDDFLLKPIRKEVLLSAVKNFASRLGEGRITDKSNKLLSKLEMEMSGSSPKIQVMTLSFNNPKIIHNKPAQVMRPSIAY